MRPVPRAAAAFVFVLCASLAAGPAAARTSDTAGLTLRFPSDQIPDPAALNSALADPAVTTVVFESGTNPFSSSIIIRGRSGLTLCGASRNPADTVIESTSSFAVVMEQCTGVTFRDLTIRSTAATGTALWMRAVLSSEIEGFVRDVVVRHCRVEAFVPVRGSVRARDLGVVDSRIDVTRDGGFGILWEDGPGLHVARTRFTCSAPGAAEAAVFVAGPLSAASGGDRARRMFLTRNTVEGDFANGFFLDDTVETRLRGNKVRFSSAVTSGNLGRTGIALRRQQASAVTEDFEVRGNSVRGAHTGLWISGTSTGSAIGNSLRGCGSAVSDARFNDTGCAIRIDVTTSSCPVRVDRNDLRGLQSAPSAPAVVVMPGGTGGGCFPDGTRNRVDAGREIY